MVIDIHKVLIRTFHLFRLTCTYLPNPSATGRMRYRVDYTIEFSWFEFRVFLRDWLSYEGLRA